MGLDAVELVMDVEDHFGITLQDSEMAGIGTVGDLAAIIHNRISAAQEARCPTLPAFLRLRSTVREAVGDATFRIRPHQRIAQRLSTPLRRQLWKRLSGLLGSPPPDLRRPPVLRRILAASSLAILTVTVVVAIALGIWILPMTLVVAVIWIALLYTATIPLRSIPPRGWETFGEVAVRIVGVTTATQQLHLSSADDVLTELRPLIANVLNVTADKVVSSARLIEDLGMG